MIITFVTSHLTVFGGGGIIVMDYANELIKKGYVINVIAQKIDRILYKFNDKIQLIEVGGILPKNLVYWLGFNIIVKKYMKALEHLESDILISIHFPSNFICSKFRENRKVKHIYYCLEPYRFIHDRTFISNAPFNRKILFWIIRFLFKKYDIRGSRNADKIISISEFTKARVNKIYQKDSVVHYIGKSIEDTSRKTEKFDLIMSHALLEWLAEPAAVMDFFDQHLTDDGALSLCFYNPASFDYRNLIMGNFNLLDSLLDGNDY
ncbi:hypothetical protein LCGC14_1662880, partial [marine sediment metagenome]